MLLQLQAYILINGANYRIQARVHRSGLTIVERRKHLLTDSTPKKTLFSDTNIGFFEKISGAKQFESTILICYKQKKVQTWSI